jgi:hypothetical protein
VLFLVVLAILGLLLAVGWATPLAHIVYRAPVIGKLRAVERALVLTNFAIAGLAAFGLQRLIEAASSASRPRRRSLIVIGVAVAVLPVVVVLLVQEPWFQQAMSLPSEAAANLRWNRPNAVVPVVVALASATLLLWWGWRPATRLTLVVAAGVVLLDVGVYAAFYNPVTDPGFYARRPDVLEALPKAPGYFRKATFLPAYNLDPHTPPGLLAMSWGMLHEVEDINGFNSLQPRRYTDYVFGPTEGDVSYGLLGGDDLFRPENPVLSSLNVRYVLVPAGSSLPEGAGMRRIWDNSDVIVYENPRAYPRAFFAEAVRVMTDAEAVRRTVTSDGFDGRRLALVEAGSLAALPVPSGADTVALAAWSPNQLVFTCATATSRFLVLSEMYFPGWTASVDGKPTAIHRTNYLFRGVVVPAGLHTVTFTYRPRSVFMGAAISGGTALVALAIFAAGRRKRQ